MPCSRGLWSHDCVSPWNQFGQRPARLSAMAEQPQGQKQKAIFEAKLAAIVWAFQLLPPSFYDLTLKNRISRLVETDSAEQPEWLRSSMQRANPGSLLLLAVCVTPPDTRPKPNSGCSVAVALIITALAVVYPASAGLTG
eukprot:5020678-Prymnesium_polylepis.2